MGHGIYLFFWQMMVKEIIEVTAWSIKVHNRIFGIVRSKEYRANSISGLRANPVTLRTFAFTRFRFLRFRVPIAGPITYTHNGKMIRLGSGLTEDEGKALIKIIESRFPEYIVGKELSKV
jgi:hypothetical protein